MSNNYYANLTLSEGSLSSSKIVYQFHIGKATNGGEGVGYGISSYSGRHFPTVQHLIDFLRHNAGAIEIVDECENVTPVEEFIERFLESPSTSQPQIDWLRNARHTKNEANEWLKIWDEPQASDKPARYWIDPTGRLFYSGDFS